MYWRYPALNAYRRIMNVALYGVNSILQYLHSEEILILIRVRARKMNVVSDHDPAMPGELQQYQEFKRMDNKGKLPNNKETGAILIISNIMKQ